MLTQGTGIKVVGTIPNTPLVLASGPFVNSSYVVDGSAPQNYAALTQSGVQYGIIFFQSPFIPYGNHNLVVTSLGNSSGTWLVLDYFEVIGSPASTTLASDSNNFPVDVHITTLHIMIILTALLGGILVLGLSWLVIMRRRIGPGVPDAHNNSNANRRGRSSVITNFTFTKSSRFSSCGATSDPLVNATNTTIRRDTVPFPWKSQSPSRSHSIRG